MDVKGWKRLASCHCVEVGVHGLKQPPEFRVALDDDAPTTSTDDLRQITDELDDISETLFSVKQEGASRRLVSVPLAPRLDEACPARGEILAFSIATHVLPSPRKNSLAAGESEQDSCGLQGSWV